MRRLSKAEQKLVRKIVNAESLNLTDLADFLNDELVTFEIIPLDGELSLFGWYNEEVLSKNVKETESFVASMMRFMEAASEVEKRYKKLIDLFELIDLLDKNNLIYLYTNVPDFSNRCFIGYHLDNENRIERATKAKTEKNQGSKEPIKPKEYKGFHFSGDKVIEYKKISYYSTHFSRLMKKIAFNRVHSTTALEVYVNSGFRTEDQRHNDISRIVGYVTLFIAALALVASAVFSYWTLVETQDQNKIENDRYQKEQLLKT